MERYYLGVDWADEFDQVWCCRYWILRRDPFWISLPVDSVRVVGGILVQVLTRQGRPVKALAACSSPMAAAVICAALWVSPYLETFKSRRPFSLLFKNTVAPTEPLYIYADTMNDFNFYTEREVIPVLSSRQEVADVLGQTNVGYMLIKDRILKGWGYSVARALLPRIELAAQAGS